MLAREADPAHRAFSDFRLPPGRHGISPEQVAENQRWRLLGAAAEVLAEHGHVNTTSTRVSKHAGVSPATFYQHFDNIGECLLAAYEAASDCVREIVSEACGEERIGWPERLGVAVASILRFLAVEPATAHLLGPEAAAGEPAVAAARRASIERLAARWRAAARCGPRRRPRCPRGPSVCSSPAPSRSARSGSRPARSSACRSCAPELTAMLCAPYVG